MAAPEPMARAIARAMPADVDRKSRFMSVLSFDE
jgi:hypothetical protein